MMDCGLPVDTLSPFLLLVRELVSLTFGLAIIGMVFDGCLYFSGRLLTGFPGRLPAVWIRFLRAWGLLFWVINRNGRPFTTTVLN